MKNPASFLAAFLLAALPLSSHAAPDALKNRPGPLPAGLPAATHGERNFQVDVSVEYQGLGNSARFIVGDGTQANHVDGGEKAYPVKNSQGTGIEFKRWGFIVNILPVQNPADPSEVSVQLQIEISGPVKSATSPLPEVPDISTWQFQSALTLEKGRKTVVVEKPARVELTLSEAKRGS